MFTVRKILACALLGSFVLFPLNLFAEKEEKEWFSFYIPWNYCPGSKMDMSFILDAPAGKHGFVTVKDGHFYFKDGKNVKFWGLNLHSNTACFPARNQAQDVAKRLAQLGCNIVRMHLLDNEDPGGIIDVSYKDSQHLSVNQMDKLDYFISELKKNGIYVCFDVLGLGARKFKSGDNLPQADALRRGAGGISFFDERIKELSRKFAMDFLSHVNLYTGNSYLNEPCVAFVEMTNENTLFLERSHKDFPSYYEEEVHGIWKKWHSDKNIKSNYKDWYEDRQFLYELQDGYQRDMYKYLRSIGVKVPIGASNLPYDNLGLLADSHMDFTDTHVYWDLSDELVKIHNRPLIKQDHANPYTMINTMSIAKVKNRPLIITEWGSAWPNDWRAVDVIKVASYAALNNWDGLFMYSYNGGWGMSWNDLENRLYYGTVVFTDPAKMGLFPAAGLIFLRGAIKEAKNTYKISYDIGKLFKTYDMHEDRIKLAGIPYTSKLEKDFNEAGDSMSKDQVYPNIKDLRPQDIIKSDTGEILRDFKKGIFMLNARNAFSFSGFIGGQNTIPASDNVSFFTEKDFATFTIVSLDGKKIIDSRDLLLTVVGRVRNTGQSFAPHITKKIDDLDKDVYILNKGSKPITVEPIEGVVTIKKSNNMERVRVFCLNENGLIKSEIQADSHKDYYSFRVSGADRTIYYKIVKE